MIIETKFNLSENVFFMHDNKVTSAKIIEIKTISILEEYAITPKRIFYCLHHIEGHYDEDNLFRTKEDLIKSL